MAADDYRARAAELLARSKLERDPEVADLLETIARGFQQRGVVRAEMLPSPNRADGLRGRPFLDGICHSDPWSDKTG
jgi:hypothetical protein